MKRRTRGCIGAVSSAAGIEPEFLRLVHALRSNIGCLIAKALDVRAGELEVDQSWTERPFEVRLAGDARLPLCPVQNRRHIHVADVKSALEAFPITAKVADERAAAQYPRTTRR